MEIGKLSGLGSISGRPASAQKSELPQASERGLVPIAPDGAPAQKERPESNLHRSTRPSPAFLAQLIATAQRAPQTRARGRAAPAEAIAHYASAVSVSAPTQIWDWSV